MTSVIYDDSSRAGVLQLFSLHSAAFFFWDFFNADRKIATRRSTPRTTRMVIRVVESRPEEAALEAASAAEPALLLAPIETEVARVEVEQNAFSGVEASAFLCRYEGLGQ